MVRLADVQAHVVGVAVHLEEIPVGEIHRGRVERPGVIADIAVLIHHHDGAQVLGGGGAVEQEAMPGCAFDALYSGFVQALADALQRQVIEMHGTADIAGQHARDVPRRHIGGIPGNAPVDPEQRDGRGADAGRDQHRQYIQGAMNDAARLQIRRSYAREVGMSQSMPNGYSSCR
ncbi:hypothetical protein [Achromobacter agilis]|uniref:hypothetical protein n=1 Tax=Achromobacter agilis TaxID=1353888 RepID=UPI001ABFCB59|nr:hypothetical protein [Achromobacter agilis]